MSGHIIERAFQLARSGECNAIGDISLRLRREGYTQVDAHLGGKLIKAQLVKLMLESQARVDLPQARAGTGHS
jgi:hypothetical protein